MMTYTYLLWKLDQVCFQLTSPYTCGTDLIPVHLTTSIEIMAHVLMAA